MNGDDNKEPSGGDTLSNVGLVLHFVAIVSMALWLSMVGGSPRSGTAAVAGAFAIGCFAVSCACFAADRPRQDAGRH